MRMGPIIEPPGEKLAAGLTELGEGETWLAEPRQLDEEGRLWTPGVRIGVHEGSAFHRTEYFGPVLGIMHADTLEDAVRMQNGTDYGLTAGPHSLEPSEIAWWTEHVEAGNLYVNRGITGAIVQRQPFGGWKRSAIGQTAKAGGPHYLPHLQDLADSASVPPAPRTRRPGSRRRATPTARRSTSSSPRATSRRSTARSTSAPPAGAGHGPRGRRDDACRARAGLARRPHRRRRGRGLGRRRGARSRPRGPGTRLPRSSTRTRRPSPPVSAGSPSAACA
ncbi:aldehyde dehydrogenase family protein [Brachybacterium sp. GPGPB12]|uniref:aldehyde dehydrogenase family protein n=1 Tax=Brachybacterium sp. GPGPB12 TaxID=3023517 RepID=UPI0031343B93